MGGAIATITSVVSLATSVLSLGIKIYDFVDRIRTKGKESSKRNEEKKEQNIFNENKREMKKYANMYQNQFRKYNRNNDRWNGYNDDVDFDDYYY
jgi:hypothetical protein